MLWELVHGLIFSPKNSFRHGENKKKLILLKKCPYLFLNQNADWKQTKEGQDSEIFYSIYTYTY